MTNLRQQLHKHLGKSIKVLLKYEPIPMRIKVEAIDDKYIWGHDDEYQNVTIEISHILEVED